MYIHYGNTHFDPDLVAKVHNRPLWTKPLGGLWASRVDAKFGWKDWNAVNQLKECVEENSFTFLLTEDVKVLEIRSVEDLDGLLTPSGMDFEQLLSEGIDAVELFLESRDLYYALYGWDCDSILIMNKEVIIPC